MLVSPYPNLLVMKIASIFACLWGALTQAVVINVNLTSVGYNYAAILEVISQHSNRIFVPSVLSSANDNQFVYSLEKKYNVSSNNIFCYKVFNEDESSICYLEFLPYNATNNVGILEVGSTKSSSVNYTVAAATYLYNKELHYGWLLANGSIGLAYPTTKNVITPFQSLLQGVNSPSQAMTFGLDFNEGLSGSTMQLGGVKEQYSKSLQWFYQPSSYPSNHVFFLENITFCGNSLLSNYSNNWPVVVDSGSVCMSLPSEFYDTFLAWLDNSTVISIKDLDTLPAISFQLAASNADGSEGEIFFIPLGDLVVNSSALHGLAGAPRIHLSDSAAQLSLCILRGSSVNAPSGFYNTPKISLGALALRAIYFAADFNSGGVGLASKYSGRAGQYGRFSNQACKAKAHCEGDQSYWYGSNSCADPACSRYFFTVLNKSTHKCEFTNSATSFGLFLVIFIALLEISAYFLLQDTAVQLLGERDNRRQCTCLGWGRVDPLTRLGGIVAGTIWDFILRHLLKVGIREQRAAEP